jgi:hypothetical protein
VAAGAGSALAPPPQAVNKKMVATTKTNRIRAVLILFSFRDCVALARQLALRTSAY